MDYGPEIFDPTTKNYSRITREIHLSDTQLFQLCHVVRHLIDSSLDNNETLADHPAIITNRATEIELSDVFHANDFRPSSLVEAVNHAKFEKLTVTVTDNGTTEKLQVQAYDLNSGSPQRIFTFTELDPDDPTMYVMDSARKREGRHSLPTEVPKQDVALWLAAQATRNWRLAKELVTEAPLHKTLYSAARQVQVYAGTQSISEGAELPIDNSRLLHIFREQKTNPQYPGTEPYLRHYTAWLSVIHSGLMPVGWKNLHEHVQISFVPASQRNLNAAHSTTVQLQLKAPRSISQDDLARETLKKALSYERLLVQVMEQVALQI